MKQLLTIALILIVCLQADAQPRIYREYFEGDSFNGIDIILYSDLTYKYKVYHDVGPSPGLTGKYTIRRNKLHLLVDVPDFSDKSSIDYKQTNDTAFTIQLVEVDGFPLSGAVVSWNKGTNQTTNDYGMIRIPPKDNAQVLHVNYLSLNRDSIFTVDQQKGQQVVITVAMKKINRPLIYDIIIPDWFITGKGLCRWEDRLKKKKHFIKRTYLK